MATKAVPSQEVQAKAARYLLEGRVQVDMADRVAGLFIALVKGGSDYPYAVRHTPSEGWKCMCPANYFQGRMCAHVTACMNIWQPEGGVK